MKKCDKGEGEDTADDEFASIFNESFNSIANSTETKSSKKSFEEWKQRLITKFVSDPVNFNNIKIRDEADPASFFWHECHEGGYEAEILKHYKIPGIWWTGMPSVPEKSEWMRNYEKTWIYPFSTLPIEELERGLIFETVTEKMNEKEPDYKWEIFHSLEERLSESAMQQTLANLILWNPDAFQKQNYHYYPWDDALLMTIYNKIYKER